MSWTGVGVLWFICSIISYYFRRMSVSPQDRDGAWSSVYHSKGDLFWTKTWELCIPTLLHSPSNFFQSLEGQDQTRSSKADTDISSDPRGHSWWEGPKAVCLLSSICPPYMSIPDSFSRCSGVAILAVSISVVRVQGCIDRARLARLIEASQHEPLIFTRESRKHLWCRKYTLEPVTMSNLHPQKMQK